MADTSAEPVVRTNPSGDATIVTLIALVLLLTGGYAGRGFFRNNDDSVEAQVRRGVNPNTAPWWELTALPGVGESSARRIVAHRESGACRKVAGRESFDDSPCFQIPADLEPVHDIGPRTIQRIAPHLRFDTDESNLVDR